MRKILLLLVGLCFSLVSVVEARTYTNEKYGYAIDIPDYFVERNNMGMFDFRADGGDNYGVDNLLNRKEGIGLEISSKSCEYDSVNTEYMKKKVAGYIEAAQRAGIEPSQYFVYKVSPNHDGIGSMRVDQRGDFIHAIMGIEVVLHGRTVSVLVEGTAANAKEMGQIIETFRCLKH